MNAGSVNMSQIMKYKRMDAGFHLAINAIKDDLIDLQAKGVDPEACKAQLKALPYYALRPLSVLTRGSHKAHTTERLHRAIDEYPLEAWLIVRANASAARDELAAKERELEEERAALSKLL